MLGGFCAIIIAGIVYTLIGFCVYIALAAVWGENWNRGPVIRIAAAVFFPIVFFRVRNSRGVRIKKEWIGSPFSSRMSLILTLFFWPARLAFGLVLALIGVILMKPYTDSIEIIAADVRLAIRSCRRALQRSTAEDERARLKQTIGLLEAVLDPKKRLRLIRTPQQAADDTKPSA